MVVVEVCFFFFPGEVCCGPRLISVRRNVENDTWPAVVADAESAAIVTGQTEPDKKGQVHDTCWEGTGRRSEGWHGFPRLHFHHPRATTTSVLVQALQDPFPRPCGAKPCLPPCDTPRRQLRSCSARPRPRRCLCRYGPWQLPRGSRDLLRAAGSAEWHPRARALTRSARAPSHVIVTTTPPTALFPLFMTPAILHRRLLGRRNSHRVAIDSVTRTNGTSRPACN